MVSLFIKKAMSEDGQTPVLGAGLEPASLAALVPKTRVFAVSPPEHVIVVRGRRLELRFSACKADALPLSYPRMLRSASPELTVADRRPPNRQS